MKDKATVGAVYTRVSSPSQATADAVSLPEQEQIARGLIGRRGAEVVEHYQDAGKSATRDSLDNRPAMRRLLADAAAGRFSLLAVSSEDRLARNTEAAGAIASVLKLAGVKVLTPKGETDFTNRRDKLIYYVNGYSAEDEAARIKERCDNGRRGHAKEGDFPVWQEPFGYKWIPGDLRHGKPNRLEAIPEQIATARLAFELAGKGGTVREIAAEINRRGLRTRGGSRWYDSDLGHLLHDARYMGRWRVWAEGEGEDRREWFARADLIPEQAVSEKAWRRAQQAPAHHKARTRRHMRHAFLLNGYLFCSECGSPMVGQKVHEGPDLRYYVCSKKKANEGKACVGRYVPAGPLEAEALALVEELAEHPEAAREYAEATRTERLPNLREERERIERTIAHGEQQVQVLVLKLADGLDDDDFRTTRAKLAGDKQAWQERLAEVGREIADAEIVERARKAVADTLAGLAGKVSELGLAERRWLLAQLDFRMELACEDWSAPGPERKYHAEIAWGGEALLEKEATRVYAGSPKARAT